MDKNILTKEQLNKLDKESLIELTLKISEELTKMNKQFEFMSEQIKLMNQRHFGKKSEKLDNSDGEQMTFIFNEAEAEIEDKEISEPEMDEVVLKSVRRKKKGKRAETLEGTPVREIQHTISDEVLKEIFPDGYKHLPDEIYRKLEFRPAVFEVAEHHIKVYKDRKSPKIVKADHPKEMLNNSVASPSIGAGIINGKFINSVPLYRQSQEFARHDVNVSRQVMANWMITVGERYLSMLYERMKKELLCRKILHADETPLLVNKDGREGSHKNYMWVYRSGEQKNSPNIILYEYQKTRKTEHPEKFLKEFEGVLVCDGYQSYHSLEAKAPDRIKVAGCWAHAKREFSEIRKAIGTEVSKGSLAAEAEVLISGIYHADNKLSELEAEEKLLKRQETVKPLVEAFFSWVREHKEEIPEKSATGKGFSYCLNQEKYLKRFLENPEIPMDNNAAERSIRSFCVGKKNWMMADSVHGAQTSAIMYSITESAKANNLKPYYYLVHVLEEIPKHMDDKNLEFLEQLLPWSDELPEECKKKNKQ